MIVVIFYGHFYTSSNSVLLSVVSAELNYSIDLI